jgi:hypothetical protein
VRDASKRLPVSRETHTRWIAAVDRIFLNRIVTVRDGIAVPWRVVEKSLHHGTEGQNDFAWDASIKTGPFRTLKIAEKGADFSSISESDCLNLAPLRQNG